MLPELMHLAEEEGKPAPALAPRIRLRITDGDRPEKERLAGEGSIDQVHADLAGLETLGCTHVLLDTYHDYLIEELRTPQTAWRMYAQVAESIFDLERGTVR